LVNRRPNTPYRGINPESSNKKRTTKEEEEEKREEVAAGTPVPEGNLKKQLEKRVVWQEGGVSEQLRGKDGERERQKGLMRSKRKERDGGEKEVER